MSYESHGSLPITGTHKQISGDDRFTTYLFFFCQAGKWAVPLPKVKPIADDEMFKTVITGKKKSKSWKRMVTKVTFVGDNFTRKAPK